MASMRLESLFMVTQFSKKRAKKSINARTWNRGP
jgi:hypothetical protein